MVLVEINERIIREGTVFPIYVYVRRLLMVLSGVSAHDEIYGANRVTISILECCMIYFCLLTLVAFRWLASRVTPC